MGESWLGVLTDLQFAAGVHAQPHPSAAEAGRGGGGDLLLELQEVAERGVDGFLHRAGRPGALRRTHGVPQQAVIEMPAALVSHFLADFLRHLADVGKDFLQAHLPKVLVGPPTPC